MKKKNMIISFLLSVLLAFASLFTFAFAAETQEEEQQTDADAEYEYKKWAQNRIMQIDSENVDKGYSYLPRKDTYIYLPEEHSDEELLECTVKWFYESWSYGETGVDATVKVFAKTENENELTLYGAAIYQGSESAGGSQVSTKYNKCGEGVYQLVEYWTPADSDLGVTTRLRFPEETWEEALNVLNTLDASYTQRAENEQPDEIEYIVVSADTPGEIISTLYSEMKDK